MIRSSRQLVTVISLVLSLVAGCYRSHLRASRDTTRDGGTDAGELSRRDAAVIRPDSGGPIVERDGGRVEEDDAGPPLPSDPDPDLGPGSRPSDYPDADDWEDLPPLGSSDPCCTMDDPIRIAGRDEGLVLDREGPVIAWGPGRWGLLGTRQGVSPDFEHDPRAVVYELSADGRSLGPPHVLAGETLEARALAWAEGRWAVGVTTRDLVASVRDWSVRLYDENLTPASAWQSVGAHGLWLFDLVRMTRGDRWVAIGHDIAALHVVGVTETGVDATIEQGIAPGRTLDAVGLRSRAAVLIGGRGFEGFPDGNEVIVLGGPPRFEALGSVSVSGLGTTRAAIAAVRDVVVTAVAAGHAVTVEAVDPFAIAALSGPQTLAVLSAEADRGRTIVDAIGSSKLGVVGVCYGQGIAEREGATWIDFRVVGPDGAPRGTAVRAVEGPIRDGGANCTVGTDEEGFLVAWWTGTELWVRRIHVRR